MENVTVDVRLRPVRFAFLVRPDNRSTIEKVFQVNSCLWGGLFNPIIPFIKRVPPWWERRGIRFDNARQIVNGYFDFFEPDFVVETEKGMADGYGVDPRRILQLKDVLTRAGGAQRQAAGLDVISLYRQMHKEEFQFVRRRKHSIISTEPAVPTFSTFAGCVFGSFPSDRALKYFGDAFKDVFDPIATVLDGPTLAKLYKTGWRSALTIGAQKLKADFHNRSDPLLFILDPHRPHDLLDFWNYRAVNSNVLAIPVQWLPHLSEFCRDFVDRNYRPLPNNPHGVMIRTTLMFARSIPEEDVNGLCTKYLRTKKPDAALLQLWYPPIWRPSPEFVVRTTRPTLEANRKTTYLSVDLEKPSVTFDTLSPGFADEYGADVRWANVIRLKDWSRGGRIATAFPCDFRREAIPLHVGLGHLISTTEGLVEFPRFKDVSGGWNLLEGSSAIVRWLKEYGIQSSLSESGRTTEQIIQTLRGFSGVRALASKGIVELLNEMSRRPITRSAHRHAFKNKVERAVGDNVWLRRVFEMLVQRRAVELGYELKCPKCGSWSWYSLHDLKADVNCHLCLRSFEFPVVDPSNSKHARWAYRVIGPFALPDFARGGYAAALAIRFFSSVIATVGSSDTTWSPGLNLTFSTGERAEVDFVLWYQRKHMFGTDQPTDFVFGESKSFGEDVFKVGDIERLKSLAKTFPGAVLVLATLKDARELGRDEVKRIRRLAEWGREYDRDRRQSRAPVIVLTGIELFSPYSLQQKWKDVGGQHANLIEPAYVSVSVDNLRILADLTQQLYLQMPPYAHWRDARLRKRQRRAG